MNSPLIRRNASNVYDCHSKVTFKGQLTELEGRQKRWARDLVEPLNRDPSEQAVEMEDDVPLEQQVSLIVCEIASVKRALERIDDGSYGLCVRCGGEISSGRLDVCPEAALCIECARISEHSTCLAFNRQHN